MEKVGVWWVRLLTSDTRLSQTLLFYDSTKQWWMKIWRANNVFKLAKMYRVSSTSCIYWLRYSTPSSSGLLVKQVCFKRPIIMSIQYPLNSSNSKSTSLIHWSCTCLENKLNPLQKLKKENDWDFSIQKLHVWSFGDREGGTRIFKLFVYVGKVMDHLSVTFYFDSHIKKI